MRKLIMLATTATLLFTVGLAWAQKATVRPRRPTPLNTTAPTGQIPVPFAAGNYSVTPASITIPTSSNPDGSVSDSGSTRVQFTTTGNPSHFTVYAKAGAANFANCNTPPASAVTVTCSSATHVTCAAAATLSSTGNGTQVATGSGNHGTLSPAHFNLTYTFQDGWNYQVGTSCSLSVSYIYTEP
jgi:hypothetical protein